MHGSSLAGTRAAAASAAAAAAEQQETIAERELTSARREEQRDAPRLRGKLPFSGKSDSSLIPFFH